MTEIPAGTGPTAGPRQITVDVEYRDQAVIARVAGTLTAQTAPALRGGLLKCLADCPDALIVDVAGLTAESGVPLTVLRVVKRQADRWPAIPMVLCRPDAALARQLAQAGPEAYPSIYRSVEDAIAALDRIVQVRPAIHIDLPAAIDSCAWARDIVVQACRDWDLDHIADDAEAIVCELVTNAVLHARPPLHLLLAVRGPRLHLAVRDGSEVLPHAVGGAPPLPTSAYGNGLTLVDALATAWGSMRTTDGKVVWATLRLTP
jgi:anti-anti-sigma regulatory factor